MLSLLGRGYALAMRMRELGYTRGVFPSWRPPVVCISVGNIGWGGSGKTPLCSWILSWSVQKKLRPVVLTRGYRARPPHLPYHVQRKSPVQAAGDEPLMLARENPLAEVVVDPCRRRGGTWAWDMFRPDLFILDDGLQHLAVQRDVDLVLIRPHDLHRDWNRVIPAGPWREGPRALQRASSLIINSEPEYAGALEDLLNHKLPGWTRPVFHCAYRVSGLRRAIDDCPGQPTGDYLLVSGVGNPDGVEASAQRTLGRGPVDHLRYPDHYAFHASDWQNISQLAASGGAKYIVCTLKDRVKLEGLADERLYVLDLELSWYEPKGRELSFSTWLQEQVGLGPGKSDSFGNSL